MTSKSDIFDIFYSKQDVVRGGGGKIKSKMTRKNPSLLEIQKMEELVRHNKPLFNYFKKLLIRDPNIAPPPRPS